MNTINNKAIDEFLGVETLKVIVKQPLVATNNEIPSSPCGACRQVIFELMNRDALVTMINPKLLNTISVKVSELLPFGFDEGKLNETKSI